jgi:hypothetical protein
VSILEDEVDRLTLEVWFVEIAVLAVVRAVSMLDEEFDKALELVVTLVRAASTLDEEPLRLRLDV